MDQQAMLEIRDRLQAIENELVEAALDDRCRAGETDQLSRLALVSSLSRRCVPRVLRSRRHTAQARGQIPRAVFGYPDRWRSEPVRNSDRLAGAAASRLPGLPPQFGVERAVPPSGRPRNERAIWSPRYWLFPSRIGGHEKSWPINTVPGGVCPEPYKEIWSPCGVTVAVFVAHAARISSIGPATDRIRRERSGSIRRRLLPVPRGRGRSMCRDCR
jgi:hypothetical protein